RNAADVTRQPASYTASPGDFRGTRRVVYALLEEGRDAEAKDAAVACAEFFMAKPIIHIRYAGMPGALIELLLEVGDNKTAREISERVFTQILEDPDYAHLFLASDLLAVSRGLGDGLTPVHQRRIEELAFDIVDTAATRPNVALTELTKLEEAGGLIGSSVLAQETRSQIDRTLELAVSNGLVVAPYELQAQMNAYVSAQDRVGQAALAAYIANDYLGVEGPGRYIQDVEWLQLARLVLRVEGDREVLRAGLLRNASQRIDRVSGFGGWIDSSGLSEWVTLIRGLGDGGDDVAGRLALRVIEMPLSWSELSQGLREAVLRGAEGNIKPLLAWSRSEAPGASLAEWACVLQAGAFWGQEEVVTRAMDDLRGVLLASQTEDAAFDTEEMQLVISALGAVGYSVPDAATAASVTAVVASWDAEVSSLPDGYYRAAAVLLRSKDGRLALADYESRQSKQINLAIAKTRAWLTSFDGDLRQRINLMNAATAHYEGVPLSRHLLALGYTTSLYDPEEPRLQGVFYYLPRAIDAAEGYEAAQLTAVKELIAASMVNRRFTDALRVIEPLRKDLSDDGLAELEPWREVLIEARNQQEIRKNRQPQLRAVSVALQGRQHQFDHWARDRAD
ncbi:MAG: hypothetical protein AAGH99_16285, partial [Planctomycetota bacterium]